jgi:hypothetical protein
MATRIPNFNAGQRVKECCTIMGAAPCGTLGTVIERGGSIYSDPAKRMVWVRWDNDGHEEAEFKKYLELV